MMILDITFSDMLAMTGIGFGTVFVILVLLVLILGIFNVVAAGKKPAAAPKKAIEATAAPAAIAATADDDDIPAIATALSLYFREVHDSESFVLTIRHHDHTAWHPENY